MSPSGAEVLRQIKSRIDEVDPSVVREQVSNGAVVVDVREPEEWATGHIPGAKHVPKSYLESRIEGAAPDRAQHVILYCASGNRSAWAARTMIEDLGYENVESMTGGFTLWKDRGYEVETPRTLTAEQRERYSRHLLLPEVGIEGQQKLLDAKVLLLGAGGLGSPAALYLAAAGVGTLGIVDNDVVDLSNLQRQVIHSTERIGVSKVDSAEQTINALNPDVKVEKYAVRLGPENIMEIIPGYDIVVDGLDNFPTRYLLNDASVRLQDPGRVGGDPRLRGPAVGVQALRRPVLPMPVPGAAAGRARSLLRRQRRARRAARDDGPAAGHRGDQADPRRGRPADRPAADVRRAGRDASPRSRSAATPTARSARASPSRSPTRSWACSPTTRRSAPARH